ncbi:MAG: T9SS type A sorting domain-containing protein [Flavobacteriales bacterium]|jgi:hypothetical protein|nr:T9SS type A sorting domain-containing protein [Flavobacteriales bacterium]
MKQLYFLTLLISLSFTGTAQVTWSDDVAEIIYNNCAVCHNPTGIAPFSLVNYQDAFNYRLAISPAVANGEMPPWTADTSYQRYAHERILTTAERTTILDWIAQGAPEGNAANTPPPPVFSNEGFLTQNPDLELQIPTYTSKATFVHDDYVCFSIPTGLTADKKIKAFEIIPGNPSIVHHTLIYIDNDGTYPTDTTSGFCNGPDPDPQASNSSLLGGYTPGSLPTVFPGQGNTNFGYTIPAGSNIVFAMHYPAGSAGMQDSTKIKIYFYDDNVSIREVTSLPAIANTNFTIQANSIDTVTSDSDPNDLPIDISVLSVFPHMHLLGKSIEAFATTPNNDTVKFARINEWDFDWQEFLFFEYIKKVPANSSLHGRGTYDNTTNNHHNPNNPPIDVSYGLNTSDEMFLVYFHFTFYYPGDENLNLDSLTYDFYSVDIQEHNKTSNVKVYPNPSNAITSIELDNHKASTTSLYIYDMRGQLVSKLLDKAILPSGKNTITWNGEDTSKKLVTPGIYFYSLINNGELSSGKIIRVK